MSMSPAQKRDAMRGEFKLGDSTDWISVCGVVDTTLAETVRDRVSAREARKEFSVHDRRYIKVISTDLGGEEGFRTTPARLEALRRLCVLFGPALRPLEVRSHRPYIGPAIVRVKRILFQMLKPLLDPLLQQQRDFNASVVSLLADLCNEAGTKPLTPVTPPATEKVPSPEREPTPESEIVQ